MLCDKFQDWFIVQEFGSRKGCGEHSDNVPCSARHSDAQISCYMKMSKSSINSIPYLSQIVWCHCSTSSSVLAFIYESRKHVNLMPICMQKKGLECKNSHAKGLEDLELPANTSLEQLGQLWLYTNPFVCVYWLVIGAVWHCILFAHLNCSGSQRSQGAVFMSGKVPIMKPTTRRSKNPRTKTGPLDAWTSACWKWSHEEVSQPCRSCS